MSENDLNQNDGNAANLNLMQDINDASPFIKEKDNSQGTRTIEIMAWKGIYYSIYILLAIEAIQVLIAFTVMRKIPFTKWLLILILLPFIILFLFIPVKAICKYDYNNKKFSSYITPIIPIPYSCYSININFSDIAFFYFFKFMKCGKKYFKIGINSVDGEDHDIILGQCNACSLEYDKKLNQIPFLLKLYLRE